MDQDLGVVPVADLSVLAVVATLDDVRVTMNVRFSSHLVPELIHDLEGGLAAVAAEDPPEDALALT